MDRYFRDPDDSESPCCGACSFAAAGERSSSMNPPLAVRAPRARTEHRSSAAASGKAELAAPEVRVPKEPSAPRARLTSARLRAATRDLGTSAVPPRVARARHRRELRAQRQVAAPRAASATVPRGLPTPPPEPRAVRVSPTAVARASGQRGLEVVARERIPRPPLRDGKPR